VIEGVESEDVLWRLRDLGCDAIQGFYYSWPLRREDFEEYVVSAQS
jgi:EAL domain-containing protein (putative c-di-GMP-specific phosphodiesterase class I)